MPHPPTMTWPSIILKFALFIAIFGLLLFVPAGTIYWLEGWLFIGIYVVWAMIAAVWLKKNNPDLLRKRLDWKKLPPSKWEKIIFIFLAIFMLGVPVTAGLDVRFGWSTFPVWLKVLGFLLYLPGFMLLFSVMKVNTFLARVVEIQKGHKVITTGPYKYVRHPMYVGASLFIMAMALGFGSFYAIIPAVLSVISLMIRIIFEERLLHKELEGYTEYTKKNRYRLIPGIW